MTHERFLRCARWVFTAVMFLAVLAFCHGQGLPIWMDLPIAACGAVYAFLALGETLRERDDD